MSKDVKALSVIGKMDAFARITRNLCKSHVKEANLLVSFDVQNGDAVRYSYGTTEKGFSIFDGKDFKDLPDMSYIINIVSPLEEPDDFRITVEPIKDYGIVEAMQTALCNKIGKDLLSFLQGIDLMPITRSKSSK